MIKAVLFDLDGTLIDHRSAGREALRQLLRQEPAARRVPFVKLERRWLKVTGRYLRKYLSGRMSFDEQRIARVRALWSGFGGRLSAAAALEKFDQYLNGYEAPWRLYGDVWSGLDGLAGWKLGIVTNGDPRQQRQKLIETGIADRFAALAISGESGFAKPDPRLFAACLSQLAVKPEEAVFVGASFRNDWLGARRAGMRAIWLARELSPGWAGISPVPIVTELSHIKQAILRFVPGEKEPGPLVSG
jgi:putative hydrolase of the HAD superfamily